MQKVSQASCDAECFAEYEYVVRKKITNTKIISLLGSHLFFSTQKNHHDLLLLYWSNMHYISSIQVFIPK